MTAKEIGGTQEKIRREDPVKPARAVRLRKVKPGAPLLFFPSLGPTFTKS